MTVWGLPVYRVDAGEDRLSGPPVDGRIPHYATEDSSVPLYWSRAISIEELPEIRKVAAVFPVTSEALEDAGGMRAFFEAMFDARPLSWAERADRELYRYRLGFRLRSWWRERRRRLANRIDPDRYEE